MYRDGKPIITSEVQNFVLNNAALGDMISSLPAIAFARLRYPEQLKLRVWLPTWHHELVGHLLAPYGTFEIRDLQTFPAKWEDRQKADIGPVSYNAAMHDTHTRCRVHMVDFAFNFLINARPENMEQRSYPTRAALGPKKIEGKYVVFPQGATSDNKLFKASVMQPVMEWCLDQGYRPVLTGTKTSHTNTMEDGVLRPIVMRAETDVLSRKVFAECIDVREDTTLLELRDILGHAAAVVGVDGGTMHLAGTTDVPIVFASGTTLAKHRYIPRHGDHTFRARYIGPRDLECAGCQSNWPMTTLHFTRCAYGDNACMDLLHPDDFIQALKELT